MFCSKNSTDEMFNLYDLMNHYYDDDDDDVMGFLPLILILTLAENHSLK